MVLDATSRATSPLTAERILGRNAALFPTGYSGMSRIAIGQWRNDADGPMKVVSGPLARREVLNRALDGLESKLTSSKWGSLAKCSPDTALRDITQLLDLGVLTKAPVGGRSTAYELAGG